MRGARLFLVGLLLLGPVGLAQDADPIERVAAIIGPAPATAEYVYVARVVDIYDGDTVTVDVDLGFGVTYQTKLRLMHIDTPEVKGASREAGLAARDRARALVLGRQVLIRTVKDKKEKYGRYLVDIWYQDGSRWSALAVTLLREGHGVPYEGGARQRAQPRLIPVGGSFRGGGWEQAP